MIKLDLQSRLPIYEQLKDQISELVMLGELVPQAQLPSVRSFARDLGINPNTVQKAYQDLERDGIIYSVSGRGSYISPDINLNEELQKKHLQILKQAVQKVKSCGISAESVFDTVRSVYRIDMNDAGGSSGNSVGDLNIQRNEESCNDNSD